MSSRGNPGWNPGDAVVVRQWDDMASEYTSNAVAIQCPGDYDGANCYCTFLSDMKELCGRVVHIREAIWLSLYSIYVYLVEESSIDGKYFVETMFEKEPPYVCTDLDLVGDEELSMFLRI